MNISNGAESACQASTNLSATPQKIAIRVCKNPAPFEMYMSLKSLISRSLGTNFLRSVVGAKWLNIYPHQRTSSERY